MRALLVAAITIAWVVAALAGAYIHIDLEARRRSPSYRDRAAAWDAEGPRWRWWVLIGATMAGSGLTAFAMG
jgi:hypothetical protein